MRKYCEKGMSGSITATGVNNTPTIPIKPVPLKKFVPLVVSSISGDFKIQAKLFDVRNFVTVTLATIFFIVKLDQF